MRPHTYVEARGYLQARVWAEIQQTPSLHSSFFHSNLHENYPSARVTHMWGHEQKTLSPRYVRGDMVARGVPINPLKNHVIYLHTLMAIIRSFELLNSSSHTHTHTLPLSRPLFCCCFVLTHSLVIYMVVLLFTWC